MPSRVFTLLIFFILYTLNGCNSTIVTPTSVQSSATAEPVVTPTVILQAPISTVVLPSPTATPDPFSLSLRLATPRGWNKLDPFATTSADYYTIFANTFSSLVRYKTGAGTRPFVHEVIPDLASSWEQPDDKTYIFHLNQNARWSDLPAVNGRSVTGDDIVQSLEYLMKESVHSWMWTKVKSIDLIDEMTVRISMRESQPSFLDFLASGFNVIMPTEIWESDDRDLARGPLIGSGPFVFMPEVSEYTRAAEFRRNPNFYESSGNVEYLSWLIIPNDATRVALFETGQLDALVIPPEEIARYTDNKHPDHVVGLQITPVGWMVSLNHQSTVMNKRGDKLPFADGRVREALSLAIDREDIFQTHFFKGASLLGSSMPVSSHNAQLKQDELQELLRHDSQEAKALLQDTLPAGQTLQFELIIPNMGQMSEAIGELIAGDFREIGAEVEVVKVSLERYIATVLTNPGNFQSAFGPSRSYFSAEQWLRGRFFTNGAHNGSSISNTELDMMIDIQSNRNDPKQRAAALRQAQRLVLENYHSLPIHPDAKWLAVKKRVSGWSSFHDYPHMRFLRDISLKDS